MLRHQHGRWIYAREHVYRPTFVVTGMSWHNYHIHVHCVVFIVIYIDDGYSFIIVLRLSRIVNVIVFITDIVLFTINKYKSIYIFCCTMWLKRAKWSDPLENLTVTNKFLARLLLLSGAAFILDYIEILAFESRNDRCTNVSTFILVGTIVGLDSVLCVLCILRFICLFKRALAAVQSWAIRSLLLYLLWICHVMLSSSISTL